MEPIKDLDLLIAAGDQMAVFFRAFERLPRVLQVIKAAEDMPASLKKEIDDKQIELGELKSSIHGHKKIFDRTKESLETVNDNLNALEGKMEEKKKELLEMMDKDVQEARKAANEKMQRSLKDMNKKLADHVDTIHESEEKLIESVNFHKEQIEIYNMKEKEAKALADEAMVTLEKIKKSFE